MSRQAPGLMVILGGLLGLGLPLTAAAIEDVCEQQVREYVRTRLGGEVTGISYVQEGSIGPYYLEAWVTTDACQGSLVFRLNATELSCRLPYYGRRPNYISGVSGHGGCRVPAEGRSPMKPEPNQ